MHNNYFPLFLDMTDKEVLVFGAGKIAARRVDTLLRFGVRITLVAPEISDEMQKILKQLGEEKNPAYVGCMKEIVTGRYRPGCISESMDYVLAVTDDDSVNEGIYRECRHREIPVNVASDQTKCDFYFPAVIETEDVTVGVTSGGRNHKKVSEIANLIREKLK